MAQLTLKNINKIYEGGFQAVYDFNIDVKDGEFIALVGPSGCGKSTTLRMIAGLEEISSGDMILGENRINDKAPADRDIAMVFQNYALYGNMTVYENIGFSLTVRKQDEDTIHKAVMEASEVVELNSNLNRKPAELSGGQRQRVALGRAIVRDAKLFLMDEPLSNLDAKLRSQTRKEIVALTSDLNATVVYVTHDQVEAMAMADRIAIMDKGRVKQIGTPKEVYNDPDNVFVASFIGTPPTNFIYGKYEDGRFKSENINMKVKNSHKEMLKGYEGKNIIFGIRPEYLYLGVRVEYDENYKPIQITDDPCINIEIDHLELLGKEYLVYFYVDGNKYVSKMNTRTALKIGEKICLKINMDRCYFFDVDTENRIR